MWSVVIESRNRPSTRASMMSSSSDRALRHAGEIRRVLHIRGGRIPLVGHAALDRDLAPIGVALEHVGIFLREQRLGDVLADEAVDLARRRPDVLQENLLALLVGAERHFGEIELHRSRERISDDQRRRGEIIRAHVRIDAAFEIAVAGENGGGDEIVLADGFGDFLRQRTGIADAGGAAEADEVEPDRVEILLQAGLGEIFADHLRAGRERGLHPRFRGQAFLAALRANKPAPIITLGLEVLVQEVMAAITTSP